MGLYSVTINFWAVLVSAVVALILGMFWYSPKLFGPAWLKAAGISRKAAEKTHKEGMGKSMVIYLISLLVAAYVLANVIGFTGAVTSLEGIQAGLFMGLGFIATASIGAVLWESKSWDYYFINVGYWLVSLAVMGAIIASWA